MHRYYVSFSHQECSAFGIASLDLTVDNPITGMNDLDMVYGLIAEQGYRNNVKILAFSRYANPHQATQPGRRPNRGRSS